MRKERDRKMIYNIGLDFKNKFTDIFAVQAINNENNAIANYSYNDGEERLDFASSLNDNERLAFIQDARKLYKTLRG